ncbi:uncharacterized protein LOC105443326 [Strongylocentrotus purpuratus]|uniref:C2H2-type domain-containing protein n=1 Tax=Strongylocentrotus purpuratus TaxID=7668 RepID=A0A7M7HK24_STRPU|nr:uncharacterized protein LOC105443326 [Strongylocentrotus purpuratus]
MTFITAYSISHRTSARSPTSVATHMNDVHHCILNLPPDQTKSVLFLLADGGPDFHPNHGINELYYSRLFRDLNLDAMVVTCYAPGDSALNPIEHLWAPCTRALTSVYLPTTLPGEDRPPNKQPGLSGDELQNKESMVFNSAMAKVKDIYWRNLRFAGQRVTVHVEPSGEAPHPYGQDYGKVKLAINKSARQLRQSDLYPEFTFMSKHIDKRIGTVIFAKCDGADCCHCADHPPSLSAEDMAIMRKFPSPKPSVDHPGHFETFLEALSSTSNVSPCEHMPIYQEKGLGRCCKEGCRYVYTSKKDQHDHRLKVHIRV